ncbi:hypothetical protein [Gilliamella sp. Pas-s95]|uniref:hypothetical protein n=1 Tax=Gilliamella sp. Pas-s95 TaxID=2687317 RepID=UPI00132BBF84|nr:hypothetical protein [Gilliamella sp. Pas-s95]MWN05489.1 hypothetical protein [Gilliamella sp. Pas-s95]
MRYHSWILVCQNYALNFFQYHRSLKQTPFSFLLSKSSSLASPSGVSSRSRCKPLSLLSKSSLAFAALLLLSCSFGTQALSIYMSSSTSNVIEGSEPYLTFDGGRTKEFSAKTLLSITLPDGRIIKPTFNTSNAMNPIRLPYAGITLGDIGTLIPPSADSVSLNDLVNTYHYWGDADGDGEDTNGVTVTGSISVNFTDKDGNTVGRNDILDSCKAPYKITLSSTEGSLTTQYGVPNTSHFDSYSVSYYINPYDSSICYIRPNLNNGLHDFRGPANIWNPGNGFLVQSTSPLSYGNNFPTTGADGLYFDLIVRGGDGNELTWSPVTLGGITATVTWVRPNKSDDWIFNRTRVARVTLTGPRATPGQVASDNPSTLEKPSLPQTFELVGKDSSGNVILKYGFMLKQWFVNRGYEFFDIETQTAWCNSLGYRMPHIKDLTNAKCGIHFNFRCVDGIDGATPSSSHNFYQRQIGAGFFTEWGQLISYSGPGFGRYENWTSDASGNQWFSVSPIDGKVLLDFPEIRNNVVCTVP